MSKKMFKQEPAFVKANRKSIARGAGRIVSYNPFKATQVMFRDALDLFEPLSYDEWMMIPDDNKAAALYVQFYPQITLAWYKCKSFYTLEEDGVSTMMQYLIKNVPIIVNDKKRFSEKYIYRVAYNCLYCICHDIKRDKDRFELEQSNLGGDEGDEYDMFDFIRSPLTVEDEAMRSSFWDTIESMGQDAVAVVNNILNQRAAPLNSEQKKHKQEIVEELRMKLEVYREIFE